MFLLNANSYGKKNAPSWTPKMDSFAHFYEAKYSLPHGLMRAESLQESGYDTEASREENSYYNDGSLYAKNVTAEAKAFLDACDYCQQTIELERSQRGISFGLFQMLGENFRVAGYKKEFIDPTIDEQFDYAAKALSKLWNKYHSVALVASCWNTGEPKNPNGKYAKNIVKYVNQFKY